MSERLVTERELAGLLRRLDRLEQRVGLVEVIERPGGSTAYTPTYLGGTTPGVTTYTTQEGAYIRIGVLVVVRGSVVWTAATGTGNAQVSLPFNAVGSASGGLVTQNVTFANGTPTLRLNSGSGFFIMHSPATNAAGANVAIEAAGTIVFTVAYLIG